MQRYPIFTLTTSVALIILLVSVPLVPVEAHDYQSTTAQLVSQGSIYDQIDSMLNNLTKRFDINPLLQTDQQASPTIATPTVKITDVKSSSSTSSNTKPQVTVTLQNGNTAANGVRVSAFYSATTGSVASSDSTVMSLNAGETRAISFSPNGLATGSYKVSVVAFKDGTDPSNKATPPYDMKENAVTFTVTPSPTATPTDKATEAQDNPNAFGDVLSQVNTWILFIIAITALITIALFFVFSQNKSGGDRFEEDHFRDEYPPGEAVISDTPPALAPPSSSTKQPPTDLPNTLTRPRRRQIAIDAPESDELATSKRYDGVRQSSTDQGFDSNSYVVGDVSSKKALRNKIRGKKGT